MLRERTAVARSDGTVHSLFPVTASAAEGQALRDRVRREDATRTIEIGLGYGVAALFACEGLLANEDASARHVVIDPYQATRASNISTVIRNPRCRTDAPSNSGRRPSVKKRRWSASDSQPSRTAAIRSLWVMR